MSLNIFIQMVVMALAAVALYTVIGLIPGTDETSVLLPITLVIVLAGFEPIVVLTFFIAAIVTLNLTNAIPTVLVGLPGGVMSSPMLESALYLKEKGRSAAVIKKMAVGTLIGVLISIPLAMILASLLAPLGPMLTEYAPLLLFIGAIFLSLLSKQKIISLISIIPLALLFMGLRYLYWGVGVVPEGVNITTSFFLGITVGPLLVSLIDLINKDKRAEMSTDQYKKITLPNDKKHRQSLNPFKIISKSEFKTASLGAFLSSFLFVLSPVGLTILFGETLNNRIKDPIKKAESTIVTMNAVGQATYLSGLIIPLIAIGIPLSPISIGPGGALFNAPPVLSLENNIHHLLSTWQFPLAILTGGLIALVITYFLTTRFAGTMSNIVLRKISHEAVLGLFIAFIVLLAYMDAGLINIFGVLLIGIVCGTLNKKGMNYGIQFMTLYAAPFIVKMLVG